MRLLNFSSLYPNSEQPRHGIFVEQRLRQLLKTENVQVRVVAPVPWFPFKKSIFGIYSKYAKILPDESRHDIDIVHPRYPVIPKLGMSLAPLLMALAVTSRLKKIIETGFDFEIIDAHYFYPDGVAAVILGKILNKPVVITARGSDINVISKYTLPRKMILWAASNCRRVITVSGALKDSLTILGVDSNKITVLRNGVDLELFKPIDRAQVRRDLGIDGFTLVSVGNLIEGKGHHIVIEALADLPDVRLLIIGEGPMKSRLETQIKISGLSDRVKMITNVSQKDMCRYYNAADALALITEREGMPNVVLESIACGTPVISTKVGGIPEVITDKCAGSLIDSRTPTAVREETIRLMESDIDRGAVRKYANQFGWAKTTQGQLDIFNNLLNRA